MKTTLKLNRTLVAAFLSVTFFISCSKENSETQDLSPEDETQALQFSTEASAEADIVFNSIFDDVMGANDEVGMAGLGIFGSMSPTEPGETNRVTSCFTVTINRTPNTTFPLEIVLDFGTGCLGRDGITRSGKMKTTYTNRMLMPGAKATTVFENYKMNDISISGKHEITNTSTATVFQYNVVVENGRLSKPNGNYIEWNSNKTISQVSGLGTPFIPLDDIYQVTGMSNGKTKRADVVVAWKNEITQPLVKKFSCRWVVEGRISTVRENSRINTPWVAVLDFGNGSCDNKATVSINGSVYEISLL